VVRLIGCSGRYADQLTADAWERAWQEREARIVALKEAGRSNREVARETGVSEGTVRNLAAQKKNSAGITHPEPPDPPEKPEWQKKLDRLESPEAKALHAALVSLHRGFDRFTSLTKSPHSERFSLYVGAALHCER